MSERPADDGALQMRVCPICAFKNAPEAVMCANCGVQLLAASLPDLSPSFTTTLQKLVQECPACGHVNVAGEPTCENCGALLTGGAKAPAKGGDTGPLDRSRLPPSLVERATAVTALLGGSESPDLPAAPDPAYFDENMLLRLEVMGAPTPILVYPSLETVIGRRDPVSGHVPDVDLGVFAGYRHGISRRHAILHLHSHTLDIIDLGSSNGTFLNGRPLTPLEAHPLQSGDQLTFGKMIVRVSFVRRI